MLLYPFLISSLAFFWGGVLSFVKCMVERWFSAHFCHRFTSEERLTKKSHYAPVYSFTTNQIVYLTHTHTHTHTNKHTHTHIYIYIYIYIFLLLARPSDVFHIPGHYELLFCSWSCTNYLIISSFHRHECLPNCSFQFFGYHSTNAWIQLLSVHLTMSLALQNYVRYSAITSFTQLLFQITLLRCIILYSQHGSFHGPLWRNQSLFFLLYFAGTTVLLKVLVGSCPAFPWAHLLSK